MPFLSFPSRDLATALQRSSFIEAIQKHDPSSLAILENDSGASFSYGTLLNSIAHAKDELLCKAGRADISGERIAFMVESGYEYVGM